MHEYRYISTVATVFSGIVTAKTIFRFETTKNY